MHAAGLVRKAGMGLSCSSWEQAVGDVNFLISLPGYLWQKTQASVPLTTLLPEREGLHILEIIGTSLGKYYYKS